jgi:hypothetical protein
LNQLQLFWILFLSNKLDRFRLAATKRLSPAIIEVAACIRGIIVNELDI